MNLRNLEYSCFVSVDNGNPAAQFFVTAIKPLRDGNRTMLAARAAEIVIPRTVIWLFSERDADW